MILVLVKKYISWYQTMQLMNRLISTTLGLYGKAYLVEKVKDTNKPMQEAYINAYEIKRQRARRASYIILSLNGNEFRDFMEKVKSIKDSKMDILKLSYCGEYDWNKRIA